MPMPVSRTTIDDLVIADARSADSSTRPPRGVYLMAFVTRLSNSCRSRVRSPSTIASSSTGSDNVQPRVLAEDHRGLVDVAHERLQLDRLAMQVEPPFVGARQRQQAVDEIRHARRLLQRLLERDQLLGAIRRRDASRARRRRAAP